MSAAEKKVRAPKRERDEGDDAYYERCFAAEGTGKPYGEWTQANLIRKCKYLKLVTTYGTKEDLVKRIENHESGRYSHISRLAHVKQNPKALVPVEPKQCVAYDWARDVNVGIQNIPMDIWKSIFWLIFCSKGNKRNAMCNLLFWRVTCKYFHRILTGLILQFAKESLGDVPDLQAVVLWCSVTKNDMSKETRIIYEDMFKQSYKRFEDSNDALYVNVCGFYYFKKQAIRNAVQKYGSARGIKEKLNLLAQYKDNTKQARDKRKKIKQERILEMNTFLKKRGLDFSINRNFGSTCDQICELFQYELEMKLGQSILHYYENRGGQDVFELLGKITPAVIVMSSFYWDNRFVIRDYMLRKKLFNELYETYKDTPELSTATMLLFFSGKVDDKTLKELKRSN